MLPSTTLQGRIVQPRAPADPRVAKVDETQLRRGSDGILYRMLDPQDWQKFRTVTDSEMREEANKSREMQEEINSMSGKTQDGKVIKRRQPGVRVTAPQFGLQARKAKQDKKAWDSEMAAVGKGQVLEGSAHRSTMEKLMHNSATARAEAEARGEQDEDPDAAAQMAEDLHAEHQNKNEAGDGGAEGEGEVGGADEAPVSQDGTVSEEEAQTTWKGMNTNMSPIHRDHVEKFVHGSVENTPPSVSTMVRESGQSIDDLIREELQQIEAETPALTPPSFGDFEPNTRPSSAPAQTSTEAAELAGLLNGGVSSAHMYRSRDDAALDSTYKTARSDSAPRARTRIHQQRFQAHARSTSADKPRGRSSYSGTRMVSASLEADADRYIQKRRLLDQQDRSKKLEEEGREQRMKERHLRASLKGKEFSSMMHHQQVSEEVSRAKLEKERQKQWEVDLKEKMMRKAKIEANKQSMAMVTKNQLAWREIQQIEETKRRERIDRRKQEMARISTLPSGIENQRKRKPPPIEADVGEFRAQDPATVAAKLDRQQKLWDLKLLREKERMQEMRESKILAAKTGVSTNAGALNGQSFLNKTGMEVRTAMYAARREQQRAERQQRADDAARKKEVAGQRHMERLLNMKIPEGKPTQAAICRAEKVRADIRSIEEQQHKQQVLAKRKDLASREAAVVLKTIISEREIERRQSHGGFIEISATQKSSNDEYAAARRANQKRIADSLKNRKSLIERHDLRASRKSTGNQAVQSIIQAAAAADNLDDIFASL